MSIVFAILFFSFLIFIHELGHFVAAKLSGVRVNEFALFMGPVIFKKQVGETTYSLRCIPFGGFCAMEGEDGDSEDSRAFGKAACMLLLFFIFLPNEQFVVPVIGQAEQGNTVVYEEGLHIGDRILEVNGEKIYVSSDFSMLLSLNPGDTYDILVERQGQKVLLEDFKMETHLFTNEDGTQSERYGITFSTVPATLGETISYSWNTGINIVRTVRLSLQMLVSGQAGLKDMTGPVGIVQIMSDTAEASATALDALLNMLYFGAFFSINLAVMNLLPIPALDGGRVVGLLITTAIEAVTRKKVNPKYEGYIHGAGMLLLLGLMAVILFKDVFTIFKG